IVAEGELRPLFGDCFCREVGIPSKATEAVEVGQREVVTEPIVDVSRIREGDETTEGALRCFAGNDVLDRRDGASDVQIEFERLFPLGYEEAEVPLLAE